MIACTSNWQSNTTAYFCSATWQRNALSPALLSLRRTAAKYFKFRLCFCQQFTSSWRGQVVRAMACQSDDPGSNPPTYSQVPFDWSQPHSLPSPSCSPAPSKSKQHWNYLKKVEKRESFLSVRSWLKTKRGVSGVLSYFGWTIGVSETHRRRRIHPMSKIRAAFILQPPPSNLLTDHRQTARLSLIWFLSRDGIPLCAAAVNCVSFLFFCVGCPRRRVTKFQLRYPEQRAKNVVDVRHE